MFNTYYYFNIKVLQRTTQEIGIVIYLFVYYPECIMLVDMANLFFN